jgi:hypothetical protein
LSVSRARKKTVRFTQGVERSGRPEVHTLWLPPDKDPELQRAQKAHRVMTIEPGSSGSKADAGTVGFERDAKLGQFLIFPKSLKPFDGARVVGIKFDLIAEPKLSAIDPRKHSKVDRSRRGAKVSTPTPTRAAGRKPSRPAPATDEEPTSEAREPASPAPSTESTVVPFEPPRRPEPPTKKKHRGTQAQSRGRPSPKPAHREKQPKPGPHAGAPDAAKLVGEIRAAMKDLERGKSVAAYQRLERAIANRR